LRYRESAATADSKKRVWITLATALLIHSLLLSFQFDHRIDTEFVRAAIMDTLTPVEKLVDQVSNSVSAVWRGYIALVGVNRENQRLQSELSELKMQVVRQQEHIVEAERLRKLLNVDENLVGKTAVARVIGRDPAEGYRSITIDKGRVHGVQVDAAVLTPEGIVGRVIHCGNYSAVVQLIVDPQSAAGVLVLPNRRVGVIKGNGGAELDLDYIDDDTELKVGDELITSGDDRIYPKGVPVGAITSVGARRGLFKTVRIKPKADMGRLEEVLCVIERPRPIDVVPLPSTRR
jgi:rod shape-determining protein MreC